MARRSHNIFHYILTIFSILIKSLVTSAVWIFVAVAGYFIYHARKSPYDIVLGIPLILVGGGFLINNLGDVANSIFSPTYNKGVCFLCSKH